MPSFFAAAISSSCFRHYVACFRHFRLFFFAAFSLMPIMIAAAHFHYYCHFSSMPPFDAAFR